MSHKPRVLNSRETCGNRIMVHQLSGSAFYTILGYRKSGVIRKLFRYYRARMTSVGWVTTEYSTRMVLRRQQSWE